MAVVALAGAVPAAAQTDFRRGGAQGTPAYSTAFVPQGHWSLAAAQRLSGLGLAPGFDPAQRPPSQRQLGRLFHRAAAGGVGTPESILALARAYDTRFRAEFAVTDGGSTMHPARWTGFEWLVGSGIGAGYASSDDVLDTGWGYVAGDPDVAVWHPPTPRPDVAGEDLSAALQVTPHRALALRGSASLRDGTDRLDEAYLAAELGSFGLWLGRRDMAFGPGTRSGVVLSATSVDGLGLQTVEALSLPWILRYLGPVHMGLGLGQRDLPRSFDDVVFLTTRGSVAPHPRLTLGVSRAVFFGGEGNTEIDWFDVFSVLIGKHAGDIASELDNQVVAVDIDFRPPTERLLPLRLYLEWGFEDSAGAWRNVPGVLAGVQVPAVPGLAALSLSVERTTFGQSCCGNPAWYRHVSFQDGWTQDGRPMGHPLGGHGDEWAAGAGLALLDARLRLDARAFTRWRGPENLYAPDREGDSVGFSGALELDIGSRLRAALRGSLEDGDGWRQSTLGLGLQAFL